MESQANNNNSKNNKQNINHHRPNNSSSLLNNIFWWFRNDFEFFDVCLCFYFDSHSVSTFSPLALSPLHFSSLCHSSFMFLCCACLFAVIVEHVIFFWTGPDSHMISSFLYIRICPVLKMSLNRFILRVCVCISVCWRTEMICSHFKWLAEKVHHVVKRKRKREKNETANHKVLTYCMSSGLSYLHFLCSCLSKMRGVRLLSIAGYSINERKSIQEEHCIFDRTI